MGHITSIQRDDAEYPRRLLSLELAPQQVWLHGSWDPQRASVAIVGSRACSGSSYRAAFELASTLSRIGFGVVSGGALGIDAAAHRGALAGGGQTCAVLGTGVDLAYPRRHAPLFEEIAQKDGCLLSIFPLGTPPKPWHFPARNRVIAALCDVVVVVEAQLGSGTRYTALAAEDLGRAVLAYPGSPGTGQLCAHGAIPVAGPHDVLAFLRGDRPPPLQTPLPASVESGIQTEQVREALDRTPRDLSELSVRTGLSPALCAAAVIDLEIHGFCTRLAGGRYVAPQSRMEHAG